MMHFQKVKLLNNLQDYIIGRVAEKSLFFYTFVLLMFNSDMMKRFFYSLLLTLVTIPAIADEGMWLPVLIQQRIVDMQENGFKLTAEDLYSVNQASLKDAIVHFNGGCTGEIISDQGLLITNHHCGYSAIQSHSSLEHDYLKDGFWAMSLDEELPNKGLWVAFLVRMEDVTDKVLAGYNESMTEAQRDSIVKSNSATLINKAKAEGKSYKASVESMYYGNQYFLFIYQVYNDVRLVGAPPSSIGKFGGDTDNWMWPRHTGDFSLFRVYADKNNDPAEYSKDNVPYKPKRHFTISSKGVKEGDFTLVYGFPGRTQEYLYSDAVKYISDISNPHKINLRTLRLDAQKKYMDQDRKVRIQYSSKNASVSNSWKKWQGEMGGIIKLDAYEKKVAFEKEFAQWAADKPEYNTLLDSFKEIYTALEPYSFARDYYNESIRVNEIISFASSLMTAKKREIDAAPIIENFFKNYYQPIDYESFIALLSEYDKNVPADFKPQYYKDNIAKFGSPKAWVDYIFENSALLTPESAQSLFASDSLEADPACQFSSEMAKYNSQEVLSVIRDYESQLQLLYRAYMRGQMEFCEDKVFYPDANSTLRIAYGKIRGYSPADGVYYKPSSTIEGIMQKDNPEIFDYNIPQALRDIYASKDYGKWVSDAEGSVPVCFIATNHTSGGNSGSPVIDAEGRLIGINFDRVWEGTMSDVIYDADICRNISLDIRYALFIIDRLGGASHLIDEMTIE